MRLRPNSAFFPVRGGRRSGYTLVEILVAMTLTLILMTAVVTVFGGVGDGIAKSRRAMEQFDRLRTAVQQLRLDLQGVTVTLGRPPGAAGGESRVFRVYRRRHLEHYSAEWQPGQPAGDQFAILRFSRHPARSI